MEITDLQAGKAGEYLVCADLISLGYIAYPSEQGLQYDVVCDVGGRLLRIQVKSTRTKQPVPQRVNRTQSYLFHVRRFGKMGRKSYTNKDLDIVALVALDKKLVAYIPIQETKQTMFFRDKEQKISGASRSTKFIQDFPFERALNLFSDFQP